MVNRLRQGAFWRQRKQSHSNAEIYSATTTQQHVKLWMWSECPLSSQCNSWCISRDSLCSNFLVSLTTRAAAFNTHCSLPVCCLGSRGEDCITIIDTWRHESVNQCRRRISVKRTPDASELTKMIKAGCADTGNVFVQTQIWWKMDSEHAYMLTCLDSDVVEL